MKISEKIVQIRTSCFRPYVIAMISILLLSSLCAVGQIQKDVDSNKISDVPKAWIDTVAKHRVIRISDEPGSRTLYFNQNVYTPDGKRMVYWAPHGLYVVDLATFASRKLVAGRTHHSFAIGTTTPTVYFMKSGDQHIYSINIDTGYELQLSEVPGYATMISTVNADETLIAGTYLKEANASWGDFRKIELAEYKSEDAQSLEKSGKLHAILKDKASIKRQSSGTTEVLFTYNIQTGQVNPALLSNNWLNHVQFSPVDPNLIMYCHEGRSNELQRVWTIHTDGMQNKLVHETASGEYATHEFWSKDGKNIWYETGTIGTTGTKEDIKAAKKIFIQGYSIETGKQRLYRVGQDQISYHYAGSSSANKFIGDGTIQPASSRWISIFHSQASSTVSDTTNSTAASGNFRTERLVNLAKNNYLKLEPNARFSPDEKWVIFTSNMHGESYVYAVEVEQTQNSTSEK